MARRSKKGSSAEPETKPAKIPEKLARPFEQAMKAIAAEKKAAEEAAKVAAASASKSAAATKAAPAAQQAPASKSASSARSRPTDSMGHYGYDDRAAFHQAFAGVRPLAPTRTPRRSGQTAPISDEERRERARVAAKVDEAEANARARLDSLVAGSVHFLVEYDDDSVYGRRTDAPDRAIDALLRRPNAPPVRIDLHGLDSREAAAEVARRVRAEAARGITELIVVHGKGLHSEGGKGVLGEVAVKALTGSAAAPHVVAFATAPMRFGGTGALLVRIERR